MIDNSRPQKHRDEDEKKIHAHLEQLYAQCTLVNISRWPEFDVMDLRGFPDPALCTFVTRSLSKHVLKLGSTRSVRLELCISTHLDRHEKLCRRVLYEAGMHCLETGQSLQAGEILYDYELPRALLSKQANISRLWTTLGMWLTEDEYEVEGEIPTYFLELVPLVPDEIEFFEADSDGFYQRCREEGEALLDFERSSPLLPPSSIRPR